MFSSTMDNFKNIKLKNAPQKHTALTLAHFRYYRQRIMETHKNIEILMIDKEEIDESTKTVNDAMLI